VEYRQRVSNCTPIRQLLFSPTGWSYSKNSDHCSASFEPIEHGTNVVAKAGAKITKVVSAIRRVADIVAKIRAANVENLPTLRKWVKPYRHWTRQPNKMLRWWRKWPLRQVR
jgi:hypothetical protein